jgi:hypothetical protein
MAGRSLVFRTSRGVGRIHLALGARDNELLCNQKENRLSFSAQIAAFIFKHCFHYAFPVGFVCGKCRTWLHEGNGTAEHIYRCSVSGIGSLTMCLGSFGQNVFARVRSADLPVDGTIPRKLRCGWRIGMDLFMVCSYRSRYNKASRFDRIEGALPNAPERRSPHERRGRCGLSGPDGASLIRATRTGAATEPCRHRAGTR